MRPRQVRYQAALRPDNCSFFDFRPLLLLPFILQFVGLPADLLSLPLHLHVSSSQDRKCVDSSQAVFKRRPAPC